MTIQISLIKHFLQQLNVPNKGATPNDFEGTAKQLLHVRHLAAYEWAVPFIVGRNVLEIGTCTGYGSAIIGAYSNRYTGIDLSIDNAQATRINTKFEICQANGQQLPFADESFDLVLTFQVFEHVWNDHDYVKEIARVLRPGGLLLASTPQRRMRLYYGQQPWNTEHIREYDEKQWFEILSGSFSNIEISGLFGDELADAIEYYRLFKDPAQHFFGGPWGRLFRFIIGKIRQIMVKDLTIPQHSSQKVLQAENIDKLLNHFFFDTSELHKALDLFALCEKTDNSGEKVDNFIDKFLPIDYWTKRLETYTDLRGTGTQFAPIKWQRWLYKGKIRAYNRLLNNAEIQIIHSKILNFGCGTGYFEDLWEALGAIQVDGIDVVPSIIDALSLKHPHRRYLCADIAEDTTSLKELGSYEIITAIDVLYHIIDDKLLLHTINTLKQSLSSNGVFIFTDALRESNSAPHVRFRSFNHWLQILNEVGLEYLDREPVFAVNNHIYWGNRMLPGISGALQHFLDVPVLRIMPWTANNWAVIAKCSTKNGL